MQVLRVNYLYIILHNFYQPFTRLQGTGNYFYPQDAMRRISCLHLSSTSGLGINFFSQKE